MTVETIQNPVNTSAKPPRPTKKAWEFPISKAYYEKVRVRGEKIMDELGYGAEWMKYLMPHIDRYLLSGERLGGNHYAYECLLIVFTCLRFDLDLAIERSAKAKARAAERRALKEAQRAEEARKSEEARKNEERCKVEKSTVVERKEPSDETQISEETQMQEVAAYLSTAGREGDGEFETTGREIADSDGTAVEEDGIFHNREAKACSSGHSRTPLVDTVEPFEEVGKVF